MNVSKPFKYIDDTFAIFSNETDCYHFHQKQNDLHPSLFCNHGKKINNSLLFFDVLVKIFNKSLLFQFVENPHSRDSIHTGIYLEQTKGRQILLAL